MMYRSLRTVGLAAVALTALASTALAAGADPVVAVVNGKEIHRSLVESTYATSQFRQAPFDKVYPQVLNYVITGQLILAEARKSKLEDDAQFKAALKEQTEHLLQQAYLSKRVTPEVTEDAMHKRYDELKRKTAGKEEVRARHILVPTEEEARAVIADLKNGAKFDDEAKAKSKDSSNQNSGGDLGYFGKEDMVPEFAEAAFAMKPGEVSTTPVKTQFGYHVIKIEDRRMAQIPPFDEARAALRNELSQMAMAKVIDEIAKAATIKVFDANGNPLPAAPAGVPGAAAPAGGKPPAGQIQP